MLFWIFRPAFKTTPPVTVNVRGGGRVMGLVRLRKSVRIVNHPPHPVKDDRSRRAVSARPEEKPPKAPNCFTY